MTRIAFVGAGAVGGYVGGHMARSGHDVTLIDPWPEHVAAIRNRGLHLAGTQGDHVVRVAALDVGQVQSLAWNPVDVAFICMKLYDTQWAASLIKPYLSQRGCVVTMQNALVEETVAEIVGWGRTLGCIASNISVEMTGPGQVRRTQRPGGDAYTVFRLGELHGKITARAESIADMLRAVDSAKVTDNLWGERWSKLVANTMSTGVCAISGLSLREIAEYGPTRKLQIRLADEAVRVGLALGFRLEPIRGLPAERWMCAAAGEAQALQEAEEFMLDSARKRPEPGHSGTAQDIAKGRWPEIDHINGYVVAQGKKTGVATPTHELITDCAKRLAFGREQAGVGLIEDIWRALRLH